MNPVLVEAINWMLLALIIALTVYEMADSSIFFTTVPQGEIIVVMVGDKMNRFIGNIAGHWVHPVTGAVRKDSEPKPPGMPRNFFGIYWLGFWPYYKRYTYSHPRNKYVKKEGGTEYEFVPKDDDVDSLYFQASYGIVIHGAETNEGLPITVEILITTQTTNAATSLFSNKSPGWLARVSGSVYAAVRDFVGKNSLEDINRLEAEIPGSAGEDPSGSSNKSAFQMAIDLLNDSKDGNPGLDEAVGQRIVAVNFLGYEIDKTGANETQNASLTAYFAKRDAEKKRIEADAEAAAAIKLAEKTRIEADAEAYRIKVKGEATAKAAEQLATAVAKNPHTPSIAIADAIAKQTAAKTLILGSGILPTHEISEKN